MFLVLLGAEQAVNASVAGDARFRPFGGSKKRRLRDCRVRRP